ncbi:MAG: GNAT family N-acetyltransferase [Chloroflexi bacterium]|nr:GNAT family N-acetyltransferase [Chloroflexota bacterium]
MGLRKFHMPQDIQVLIDIVPLAFQYPNNPEWSIDEAEKEDLIENFTSMQKLWWLFRVAGTIWSPLKDVLIGYVWEEDGRPVGVCNVARERASQQWIIGNVAVLPDYRRRGIARKLVQACIELVIERGAEQIVLDVVDGNVPAYELYKSLGFTHYSGDYVYEHRENTETRQLLSLPDRYAIEELQVKNWRIRYQLIKRITPDHVAEFEPVTEKKHAVPYIMRIIQPIIVRILNMHVRRIIVKDENGTVVGFASSRSRKNGKGTASLTLTVDKIHAPISQPILGQLVREIRRVNPGGTIELIMPDWQYSEHENNPALVGFQKRLTNHRMGMQIHG